MISAAVGSSGAGNQREAAGSSCGIPAVAGRCSSGTETDSRGLPDEVVRCDCSSSSGAPSVSSFPADRGKDSCESQARTAETGGASGSSFLEAPLQAPESHLVTARNMIGTEGSPQGLVQPLAAGFNGRLPSFEAPWAPCRRIEGAGAVSPGGGAPTRPVPALPGVALPDALAEGTGVQDLTSATAAAPLPDPYRSCQRGSEPSSLISSGFGGPEAANADPRAVGHSDRPPFAAVVRASAGATGGGKSGIAGTVEGTPGHWHAESAPDAPNRCDSTGSSSPSLTTTIGSEESSEATTSTGEVHDRSPMSPAAEAPVAGIVSRRCGPGRAAAGARGMPGAFRHARRAATVLRNSSSDESPVSPQVAAPAGARGGHTATAVAHTSWAPPTHPALTRGSKLAGPGIDTPSATGCQSAIARGGAGAPGPTASGHAGGGGGGSSRGSAGGVHSANSAALRSHFARLGLRGGQVLGLSLLSGGIAEDNDSPEANEETDGACRLGAALGLSMSSTAPAGCAVHASTAMAAVGDASSPTATARSCSSSGSGFASVATMGLQIVAPADRVEWHAR